MPCILAFPRFDDAFAPAAAEGDTKIDVYTWTLDVTGFPQMWTWVTHCHQEWAPKEPLHERTTGVVLII